MASFLNEDNKSWAMSKGEKFAIKWFAEHDFDVVLKRRTITADTFFVSKSDAAMNFRLPLGDSKINYRKVMEQFEQDWAIQMKLIGCQKDSEAIEVYETPVGEVLCGRCGHELECNDCGDMPDICPECGATLNYSYYERNGEG